MTLNKSFFIGIPTINRADLLNDALDKYVDDFPNVEIFIVDNGKQDIPLERHEKVNVWRSQQNLGVAKSWNHMLSTGFLVTDANHALILNDDIYLGLDKSAIEEMIGVMLTQKIDVVQGENHFCSFIINRDVFTALNGFDETFYPAYFEDNDFRYRMKLANRHVVTTSMLSPKVYRNSQSIAKDPNLNQRFNVNRNYYIQKWGGQPNKETYKTPFNK